MGLLTNREELTYKEVLNIKTKLEQFQRVAGQIQCRYLWDRIALNISHINPISDKLWGEVKWHRDTVVYRQAIDRVKKDCAVKDEKGNPVLAAGSDPNNQEYEYRDRIGSLLDKVDEDFKDVVEFNKKVADDWAKKLDGKCKEFKIDFIDPDRLFDKDGNKFPENAIMSLLSDIIKP
jgi:hypothetical protein